VRCLRLALPLVTLVVSAAYLWLGIQPQAPEPLHDVSDLLVHGCAYALLGGLAGASCVVLGARRPFLVAWLYVIAHGGVLEVLQYFNPPRTATWSDLTVDAVGSGLAVLAGRLIARGGP
jgi:VanZ family protein